MIAAYRLSLNDILSYELQMPANFTSGWLETTKVHQHGLGVVTEGTLPAREAFQTAEALFSVEKRELLQNRVDHATFMPGRVLRPQVSSSCRTDTQALSMLSPTVRNCAERGAPSDG